MALALSPFPPPLYKAGLLATLGLVINHKCLLELNLIKNKLRSSFKCAGLSNKNGLRAYNLTDGMGEFKNRSS